MATCCAHTSQRWSARRRATWPHNTRRAAQHTAAAVTSKAVLRPLPHVAHHVRQAGRVRTVRADRAGSTNPRPLAVASPLRPGSSAFPLRLRTTEPRRWEDSALRRHDLPDRRGPRYSCADSQPVAYPVRDVETTMTQPYSRSSLVGKLGYSQKVDELMGLPSTASSSSPRSRAGFTAATVIRGRIESSMPSSKPHMAK